MYLLNALMMEILIFYCTNIYTRGAIEKQKKAILLDLAMI